jgi:hypothetical protein
MAALSPERKCGLKYDIQFFLRTMWTLDDNDKKAGPEQILPFMVHSFLNMLFGSPQAQDST